MPSLASIPSLASFPSLASTPSTDDSESIAADSESIADSESYPSLSSISDTGDDDGPPVEAQEVRAIGRQRTAPTPAVSHVMFGPEVLHTRVQTVFRLARGFTASGWNLLMTDISHVPSFVLDCSTLYAIPPIDVDRSLRRRMSPPTKENMSVFQLSFGALDALVMSMTTIAPATVYPAPVSSELASEDSVLMTIEDAGSEEISDDAMLDELLAIVDCGVRLVLPVAEVDAFVAYNTDAADVFLDLLKASVISDTPYARNAAVVSSAALTLEIPASVGMDSTDDLAVSTVSNVADLECPSQTVGDVSSESESESFDSSCEDATATGDWVKVTRESRKATPPLATATISTIPRVTTWTRVPTPLPKGWVVPAVEGPSDNKPVEPRAVTAITVTAASVDPPPVVSDNATPDDLTLCTTQEASEEAEAAEATNHGSSDEPETAVEEVRRRKTRRSGKEVRRRREAAALRAAAAASNGNEDETVTEELSSGPVAGPSQATSDNHVIPPVEQASTDEPSDSKAEAGAEVVDSASVRPKGKKKTYRRSGHKAKLVHRALLASEKLAQENQLATELADAQRYLAALADVPGNVTFVSSGPWVIPTTTPEAFAPVYPAYVAKDFPALPLSTVVPRPMFRDQARPPTIAAVQSPTGRDLANAASSSMRVIQAVDDASVPVTVTASRRTKHSLSTWTTNAVKTGAERTRKTFVADNGNSEAGSEGTGASAPPYRHAFFAYVNKAFIAGGYPDLSPPHIPRTTSTTATPASTDAPAPHDNAQESSSEHTVPVPDTDTPTTTVTTTTTTTTTTLADSITTATDMTAASSSPRRRARISIPRSLGHYMARAAA
ncbi:hypothetical protein PHLGIDRAFT_362364 [Phlebiopsis gigantea 11061_1 CR5-6]|uniref:Uncharacterized protein n=1 Tax=Phlebiopsis gigantea (strain 11061_1 CR5-6) TaxID=745531 RepID=A0A0C3P9J9_PHLG1|nr:hypothetical protein PHLGIDRAFT_362364 [Phlebiopsis gigantea 11061_1 CR5-6]